MGNFKGLEDLIEEVKNENEIYKTDEPKVKNEIIRKNTNKDIIEEKKIDDKKIFNNENDNKLILGVSENKKDNYIFIPESSRYLNTLILGNKGTGKTEILLPKLVEQDLKSKKTGMTIITTNNDMSYNIYTLAKKYNYKPSEIIFLKPSINNIISNKFLWISEYSYDFINEQIIDYKEAIKKKKIVIIDMEILKHKSEGIRAVAMLLLQLELDMQETDITQRQKHMLYIDDGELYIPFLKDIIHNSSNYNIGVTLFIQSRNQLIVNGKDYTKIIDNDFRNILLLNSLNISDIEYYKSKFNTYEFLNRRLNSILYEIVDNSNLRRTGIVQFTPLENDFWNEINKNSKKNRTKLLNLKRKLREEELISQLKNKVKIKENVDDITYNFDKEIEDNDNSKIEKDNKILDISNLITKEDNNSIDTKKEEIKNIIKIEEKTVKRKLSQEIFNKLNKNIEVCSSDFLFSFDNNEE